MDIIDAIPILRDLHPLLQVAVLAMVPFTELRAAIPIGIITLHENTFAVLLAAVAGNLVPVAVLIRWLEPSSAWLSEHWRIARRFFDWLFARTRRIEDRYPFGIEAAIVAFVAVPLPGTGGYAGSAAVFVFGVRRFRGLLVVTLGLVVSAIVVTVLVETGMAFVN